MDLATIIGIGSAFALVMIAISNGRHPGHVLGRAQSVLLAERHPGGDSD